MLAYHPVWDPCHTAFRCLRVLRYLPNTPFELDRLRILQFYLVLPSYIDNMRLPRACSGWRSLAKKASNKYYSTGDPSLVFKRNSVLYDHVVRLLHAKTFLDGASFEARRLLLSHDLRFPANVEDRISTANTRDAELMAFLTIGLGDVPLLGQDGLKHRTGLMEYRYDPV